MDLTRLWRRARGGNTPARHGPGPSLQGPGPGPGAANTAASTGLGASEFASSTYASSGYADSTVFGPSRFERERKAGRRWSVGGVVLGALLGLVLAAPASWLADAVTDGTGGRLLLAEARGNLWNGSAVAVLTGGPGSQDASALPGRLYWNLRPTWGGLDLTLRQACCINGTLPVRVTVGLSGVTARVGDAPAAGANAAQAAAPRALGQWPTSWLSGLGAPLNTLAPTGTLVASSAGFTLQTVQGRVRLQGLLRLDLLETSSRLSQLPSLGSYRLDVTSGPGNGDTTALKLETLNGALLMDGSGQVVGGRLRFRGQARAAEGQESALANLLGIIGRRQGALAIISIG